MAQASETPWVLISVLFSTHPLDEKLALALHRVALDLHQRDDSAGAIDHQLAHGVVRNLHSEAVLGSLAGPIFEADLETERGKALVRFLLTRQGLELARSMGELAPAPHQLN